MVFLQQEQWRNTQTSINDSCTCAKIALLLLSKIIEMNCFKKTIYCLLRRFLNSVSSNIKTKITIKSVQHRVYTHAFIYTQLTGTISSGELVQKKLLQVEEVKLKLQVSNALIFMCSSCYFICSHIGLLFTLCVKCLLSVLISNSRGGEGLPRKVCRGVRRYIQGRK